MLEEKLAMLCHEQWSGWMEYLFEKSVENDDGTVTIPKWAVNRWKKQINTEYYDLTPEEQESDNIEARKFMKFIK